MLPIIFILGWIMKARSMDYKTYACLKSERLFVVIDLVVESGCFEAVLVLADIDVFWRFEDSCLVLDVFG